MQRGSALRDAHGRSFVQLQLNSSAPAVQAVALCAGMSVAASLVDAPESSGRGRVHELNETDGSSAFVKLAIYGNHRCRGLTRADGAVARPTIVPHVAVRAERDEWCALSRLIVQDTPVRTVLLYFLADMCRRPPCGFTRSGRSAATWRVGSWRCSSQRPTGLL